MVNERVVWQMQEHLAGVGLRNALIASVLLHVVVMAVYFVPPKPKARFSPPLEVILVNAQSSQKPKDAKALAQVALDGGGQADSGRATTLPSDSDDPARQRELKAAQQKLESLETLQKQLQQGTLQLDTTAAKADPRTKPPTTEASTGQDVKNQRELDVQRLQAQVAENIRLYNERPRKHFFSPKTSPYDFAIYEEAWRARVEQVGNDNYPEELRGRIYGKLRLTVYIKADGSIDNIELDKSSGSTVLDRAAIRVLRMSAPFAPFPSEIRQKADILAITRTWVFSKDALSTQF